MVLSDDTIRQLMEEDQLVIGGNPENARYGSYRCAPAKLYHGGPDGSVIDFTSTGSEQQDVILPGEYVWVRMIEKVSLPANITGFWWQTNHLSRQGLVLMNMSIVEPGYHGPLSCLFVNFGRQPIGIHRTQSLAKLVFLRLDNDSSSASAEGRVYGTHFQQYDQKLHNEALRLSASFLQLSDQVSEELNEIDKTRQIALREIEQQKERVVRESRDEFERNIPAAIKRYGVLATGVLAILIAVSAAAPWVQSLFRIDLQDQVAGVVRNELAQRVLLQGAVSNDQSEKELRELLQKLDKLEGRLQAVEKRDSP